MQSMETLPNVPFFHKLTADQVSILLPLFEQGSYLRETTIIKQGAVAIYLYLIVKGNAAIHYKPYDGPALTLTHLRAGDVFGWSAIVGSHLYSSDIVSETPMETLRIKGSQLLALLREHPETGKIILDRFAQSVSPRWKNAHEQVDLLLRSNQ